MIKGMGPIKVGKVREQFDFERLIREYYFWFAGRPVLLAREILY
jgi:hypothetical protein